MTESIATLVLIAQSIPCLYGVLRWYGLRTTVGIWASLFVFALIFEYMAITTGWPYGHFSYSGPVGHKLFGQVPWTIGFAWSPLIIGSVAIAERVFVFKSPIVRTVVRLSAAVVILVMSDMVLDPAAVASGLWRYRDTVGIYDVPWSNFLGWFISGTGGVAIYMLVNRHARKGGAQVAPSYTLLTSSWLMTIIIWTAVSLYFSQYLLIPIPMLLVGLWFIGYKNRLAGYTVRDM